MRKLSLVQKFAILSIAPMCLLGVALGVEIKSVITNTALADARSSAALIAQQGVAPRLASSDLLQPLSPSGISAFDREFEGLMGTRVLRVIVYNARSEAIYSNDRSQIGRRFAEDDDLAKALAGTVASDVSSLKRAEQEGLSGKALEVYVPLVRQGGQRVGALELYLPYAPIATAIASNTRHVYLLILVGLVLMYVVLFRIVSSASRRLRRQAEENRWQALHDSLTGLPNRILFHDHVEQAIAKAARSNASAAVLLFDLDRFKEINDTLGHHAGDQLLVGLADRLKATFAESDGSESVARLGGDEFAILLPSLAGEGHAANASDRILALLEQPFELEELTISVEASVGTAVFPDDGDDADVLIQRAEVAMYSAKDAHAGAERYTAELDEHTNTRLEMLHELRIALEQDELVLDYQPKVDFTSGEAIGVEALVRWLHPRHGLVPPDEFIPLAERTGLMRPLTRYVLDRALSQSRAWHDAGLSVGIAVNLSVRNLQDLTLPDQVADVLARHDVPAERLELEVTESALMADPERALSVLTRLDEMGIRISLDDFGTGYSSLSLLRRMPVSEIKIDRSFVSQMTSDESDLVIVRSTITLGQSLGLEVVAEGVETRDEWDVLAKLGCSTAQGYFIARPMPPGDLIAYLRDRELRQTGS